MAIVTKTDKGEADGTKAKKRKAGSVSLTIPDVELPNAASEPSTEFADYSSLIYGDRKIGKTSLCSMFPDAFFFMFEPGGKALRIHQKPMPDWVHFLAYLDLLEATDQYRTLIIDTADCMYDRSFEYCCAKHGFDHPSDEDDFGASWGKIEDEFSRAINRLLNMDRGVIFISHAKEVTQKSRYGQKYTRIVPTMPNQANKVLTSVVDNWFYYEYKNSHRQLIIRGDDLVGAGCRCQENFYTPDAQQVLEVPMGTSAAEGYKNLMKAFRNKQKSPYAYGDES